MSELKKNAIGIVIRKLRTEQKLSQEVLSGLAGIARSHLSMIEGCDKIPNLETLWKLAFALNMEPHELIYHIEEENKKIFCDSTSLGPQP